MRLPWGVISILFRFHGVCRADPLSLSPRAALIAYGKRITETLQGCSLQIDVKSMNEVNGCLRPRSSSFIHRAWKSIIVRVVAPRSAVDNVPVNRVRKQRVE